MMPHSDRAHWQHHIYLGDVFAADDKSLVEKRDLVVHRLRESDWVRNTPEYEPLHQYLDELSRVTQPGDFWSAFAAIDGEANYARAWIELTLAVPERS